MVLDDPRAVEQLAAGPREYQNTGMGTGDPSMHDHFSEVAASYNELRTTDLEPVQFIRDILGERRSLRAIDVACGGGRYSLLLCQHLPGLELILNDVNASMLANAARHLSENGITTFTSIQADIAHLTLPDGGLDAAFVFNAVHLFDATLLVEKVARALRAGGYLFIYTRLPSQNAESIWGRYFPGFAEKEDRLYSLDDMESWADGTGGLTPPSVHRFRYERRATLARLLSQARDKHYSTFSLYTPAELDRALAEFERNLRTSFKDLQRIEWSDENVMLVFRKGAIRPGGTSQPVMPTVVRTIPLM